MPGGASPLTLSRSGPIDLRVRRMENHRFKSDTYSNIGYRPAPFFYYKPIRYANVLVEAAGYVATRRAGLRHREACIGGGGGNRTRVRKRSAFGSTCLAASFDLTESPPDGQGCETASLQGFDGIGCRSRRCASGARQSARRGVEAAILCESTPGIRTHKHMTVGGWLLLKQPERSCRRWQLMRCSRIYEEAASSACTSGFITHVEAMSPP